MEITIRAFKVSDESAVVGLWQECGLVVPWNDPHKDIQRKLNQQPDLFLVGCIKGNIIATVMAGYEGHRGWINYLAVHPSQRRQGIGLRMMQEVETRLKAMGCPKINLQIRNSNSEVTAFYRKAGFMKDEVMSMGKRLITD